MCIWNLNLQGEREGWGLLPSTLCSLGRNRCVLPCQLLTWSRICQSDAANLNTRCCWRGCSATALCWSAPLSCHLHCFNGQIILTWVIWLKLNLCSGFVFSGCSPLCWGRGDALQVPPVRWKRADLPLLQSLISAETAGEIANFGVWSGSADSK